MHNLILKLSNPREIIKDQSVSKVEWSLFTLVDPSQTTKTVGKLRNQPVLQTKNYENVLLLLQVFSAVIQM